MWFEECAIDGAECLLLVLVESRGLLFFYYSFISKNGQE